MNPRQRLLPSFKPLYVHIDITMSHNQFGHLICVEDKQTLLDRSVKRVQVPKPCHRRLYRCPCRRATQTPPQVYILDKYLAAVAMDQCRWHGTANRE